MGLKSRCCSDCFFWSFQETFQLLEAPHTLDSQLHHPPPIMATHQLLLPISHCLLWIWPPCLPLKETLMFTLGFPGSSDGKESACSAGDPGSIPGWEDPLKNAMAAHSSILAWKIHGWRNLAGYSPWGCKESDTTEWLHFLSSFLCLHWAFQVALVVKNSPANTGDARDSGLIPGLGRSPGWGRSPGLGNGNPFQYSCVENPMGRGTWWGTVNVDSKNWTQLIILAPYRQFKIIFSSQDHYSVHLTRD